MTSQIGPDGRERPVAFMSKTLGDAQRRYHSNDKECLALVMCLKEVQEHLGPLAKISIFSDNLTNVYIKNLQDRTGKLFRYKMFLSQFNLDVKHKKGSLNVIADMLSRLEYPEQMTVPEEEEGDDHCLITLAQELNDANIQGTNDNSHIRNVVCAAHKPVDFPGITPREKVIDTGEGRFNIFKDIFSSTNQPASGQTTQNQQEAPNPQKITKPTFINRTHQSIIKEELEDQDTADQSIAESENDTFWKPGAPVQHDAAGQASHPRKTWKPGLNPATHQAATTPNSGRVNQSEYGGNKRHDSSSTKSTQTTRQNTMRGEGQTDGRTRPRMNKHARQQPNPQHHRKPQQQVHAQMNKQLGPNVHSRIPGVDNHRGGLHRNFQTPNTTGGSHLSNSRSKNVDTQLVMHAHRKLGAQARGQTTHDLRMKRDLGDRASSASPEASHMTAQRHKTPVEAFKGQDRTRFNKMHRKPYRCDDKSSSTSDSKSGRSNSQITERKQRPLVKAKLPVGEERNVNADRDTENSHPQQDRKRRRNHRYKRRPQDKRKRDSNHNSNQNENDDVLPGIPALKVNKTHNRTLSINTGMKGGRVNHHIVRDASMKNQFAGMIGMQIQRNRERAQTMKILKTGTPKFVRKRYNWKALKKITTRKDQKNSRLYLCKWVNRPPSWVKSDVIPIHFIDDYEQRMRQKEIECMLADQ